MLRLLLFVWTMMVASAVWSADGDTWAAYTDVRKGNYDCEGYLLCDGKVAADSTCAEFDLTSTTKGWPSFFTITIITIDPQCSGTPEFQIQGLHTTGGTASDLGSQLTEAGIDSRTYEPDFRYVDVVLTDDAACDAPGNDVAIVLCHERQQ
jgi:hypothetical protein